MYSTYIEILPLSPCKFNSYTREESEHYMNDHTRESEYCVKLNLDQTQDITLI